MLTTSYPPASGVPSGPFVHRLAARLVAAGHQVDVLAPHASGAASRVEDGVRSHFFRYAPSRFELLAYGAGMVYNLSADRRRLALLPQFGGAFTVAAARLARHADVVHGHWLPAGMIARVSSRKPAVTTVHGSDLVLARRVPALVRATLSRNVAIAVSEEMRRELEAIAPRADIRVVPPGGVELPARPYDEAIPGRLLFVGRLVDVKGVDTLMSAWPAIRAAVPHATLDVVGDGPSRTSSTVTACARSDGCGRTRSAGSTPPRRRSWCRRAATRSRSPAWRRWRRPGPWSARRWATWPPACGTGGRARRAARRPCRSRNGGRSAACRSGRRGDDGPRGAPPCGGALLVGRDRGRNARCLRGGDHFGVSRTANQMRRFLALWLFG